MTQWTEDVISAEIAGTLDGLLYQRVRRTPDAVAYRGYDAARKLWTETTWREVGQATARWQAGPSTLTMTALNSYPAARNRRANARDSFLSSSAKRLL